MTREQMRAYLGKMNYAGEIRLNRECLEGLIRAHLTGIPFENLEIFDEGRVPSIETEDIYRKIVEGPRGGYCFELNRLFYELLRGLGFDAVPVAVRIVWQKKALPPTLHRGTVVTLEGKRYFCDVGYGGPGPKGFLALEESIQEIGGDTFRVTVPDRARILVERQQEGKYLPLFLIEDREVEEADFLLMNFYSSKAETVLFTQKRIVNLCTPRGSIALTDDVLTVRENGEISRRTLTSKEEMEACLREYFGIDYVFSEPWRSRKQ